MPSWIVLNAPDGVTYFAYPFPVSTYADLLLTTTQPSGNGMISRLVLTEADGPIWVLWVDYDHGPTLTLNSLTTRVPRIKVWARSAIDIELVRPAMNLHAAGDEIFFEIEIKDATQFPMVLFTPANGVVITIRNPSGTATVTEAVMTATGVGFFTYRHQTATSDPVGVWLAEFKADHDGHIGRTLAMSVFRLA